MKADVTVAEKRRTREVANWYLLGIEQGRSVEDSVTREQVSPARPRSEVAPA